MKRLLTCILVLAATLTGCRKDTKELFDKSADERLAEVLINYQAALIQDPGWKLYVYPGGLTSENIEVGGLTYYMKFTGNNRVTMVSDFSVEMATTPKESGYNLKAIQFPSLVFDTYSYIHVAADPDPDVSSSPAGAGIGRGSDFDFAFLNTAPSDTILLKGNFNKSEGLLIRVSQAEIDAAFNGQFGAIIQSAAEYNSSNLLPYFIGADNSKISVNFNLRLNTIVFSMINASDELVSVKGRFSFTTEGIHLKEPVTIGGIQFQDLLWNDALKVYYIPSGTSQVNLINAPNSVIPFGRLIGTSLTSISVPTTALAGQSPLFTDNYNQAKSAIKTSGYRLDLADMFFIFDDASKIMLLDMIIVQDDVAFLAQYTYSYTINKNTGVARFTLIDANPNAGNIQDDMAPILEYIGNDHFVLDFYTGSTVLLGQFTSQENPDFYFTGTLE